MIFLILHILTEFADDDDDDRRQVILDDTRKKSRYKMSHGGEKKVVDVQNNHLQLASLLGNLIFH